MSWLNLCPVVVPVHHLPGLAGSSVCCLVRLHANSRATFTVERLFMSIHPNALSSFEDFRLLEHKWLVNHKISFSKSLIFHRSNVGLRGTDSPSPQANIPLAYQMSDKNCKILSQNCPPYYTCNFIRFPRKKLWITGV